MDILEKLFSSKPLVRIMRLFLFSPETSLDTTDIAKQTRTQKKSVTYETNLLQSVGFLKKRSFFKMGARGKKKRVKGYVLDETFPYLAPLRVMLIDTDLMNEGEIKQKLKNVGSLKLIIISGLFLQDNESRVDLLIVGDKIKKESLNRAIKSIEAAVGKELRFTVFSPDQFEYRVNLQDRLIRDILDYPHHIIHNTFRNLDILKSVQE